MNLGSPQELSADFPPLTIAFAPCAKGLAPLLVDELKSFGAQEVKEQTAGVFFSGNLEVVYRALLWSRLASRIQIQVAFWRGVESEDQLLDLLAQLPWGEWIAPHDRLALDFVSHARAFDKPQQHLLRAKDVIVDVIRDQQGERPDIDTHQPTQSIMLYIHKDEARVYFDLAGQSMHKRGYRPEKGVKAPLKETLAAAWLMKLNWPAAYANGQIVDGFCGSGTLLVEAAMMALDRAPGLLNQHQFLLHFWQGHDDVLWEKLLQEAEERWLAGAANAFAGWGIDNHGPSVNIARQTLRLAELQERIQIHQGDVAELAPPAGGGLFISNLPYGVRLEDSETLAPLYDHLSQVWKTTWQGWTAAVYTSEQDLIQALPWRYERQWNIPNGNIEGKLTRFVLDPANYRLRIDWQRQDLAVQVSSMTDWDLSLGEPLINRISKNQRKLKAYLQRDHVDAYRIYDADLPEFNLAIDIYTSEKPQQQTYAVVQEYAPPKHMDEQVTRSRLAIALAVLPRALAIPPANIIYKQRAQQKGKSQYQALTPIGLRLQVQEGGHRFWVNLTDYLDTGLFLDHRPVRQFLQSQAEGKHCLNLFCYTATASVYMAKGGAKSSLSIDMSNTYLDWAEDNFMLNGLSPSQHRLQRADVLTWISDAANASKPDLYDLIFCDPPSFSNSKNMKNTWDVQRDHALLLDDLMGLVAPHGQLVFSTNLRQFKMDARLHDFYQIDNISSKMLPPDYERNPKIHQVYVLSHRQKD